MRVDVAVLQIADDLVLLGDDLFLRGRDDVAANLGAGVEAVVIEIWGEGSLDRDWVGEGADVDPERERFGVFAGCLDGIEVDREDRVRLLGVRGVVVLEASDANNVADDVGPRGEGGTVGQEDGLGGAGFDAVAGMRVVGLDGLREGDGEGRAWSEESGLRRLCDGEKGGGQQRQGKHGKLHSILQLR